MVSNSFVKRFRKLDAYAKTLDDFRVRTATGGTVTMVSAFTIAMLVLFEIMRYMTPVMQTEIMVDGGIQEKLPITLDITFPHMPCYILSLDVMDESGDHMGDYDHDVYKERLDPSGKVIEKTKSEDLGNSAAKLALTHQGDLSGEYCGPCYGARFKGEEKSCCNSCEEVQRAYTDQGWVTNVDSFEQCIREGWKEKTLAQSREGCRMHGTLLVKKVRGNFHFSAGRAYSHGGTHVHDVSSFIKSDNKQNFMHTIKQLEFGSHVYNTQKQKRTKASNLVQPLDNTSWGTMQATMMYQYFLQIVPTEFDFISGAQSRTFQYSVSKQEQFVNQHTGGLPGVFFMLDHSPMRIIYSESRPTFGSFLTSLCAIIGGIFSVASIVDSVLYRAERITIQRKEM
ncbi:endoplasmic reticulum vesicle transporter-domain-containing protein [Helicostylum pulchrum]|uniref:Endoplasmic reticulum-Golgi intermediate compartment protein 3 n=1 Tax=Helicostylum pulchrum TaxID=562976 RepID=A0ABP9YBI7_9FUNG|nr:endoplasmic reticulum vesicle transporter-domain-containing protein [Helicostylum pulchrum]